MTAEQTVFPIRGYILLPPTPVAGYQGIDRNPFVPLLLDSEMDERATAIAPCVWSFYPPGWKRDAYKLYEENLVSGTGDDLDIIRDAEVAREIKTIITSHAGPHEVVACEIRKLNDLSFAELRSKPNFLGHDVAYLGGDFFSAIRAGIFGHWLFYGKPNPQLQLEWMSRLNRSGLFASIDPICDYLRCFKEAVPSEENSDFHVWAMALEP
jgi:hypothetical protein